MLEGGGGVSEFWIFFWKKKQFIFFDASPYLNMKHHLISTFKDIQILLWGTYEWEQLEWTHKE